MTSSTTRTVVAAACVGLMTSVALAAAPAEAHRQRGLSAIVLSAQETCPDYSDRFCAVEGKVRVVNRRAAGTGAIVICVGIDVHTAAHRSLSVEQRNPDGQAIIRLRPGQSGRAAYRALFDADAGVADHVHITHVHKHVVHGFGGEQC